MRRSFPFHVLCLLVITVLVMVFTTRCDSVTSSSPLEVEREAFAVQALKKWREMNLGGSAFLFHHKKTFLSRFQERMKQYKNRLSTVKDQKYTCAICIGVVKIIENQVEDNKDVIKDQILKLCDLLPEKARPVCRITVDLLADELVDMILRKTPPDIICNAFNLFNCNGCYLQDPDSMNGNTQVEVEEKEKRELQAAVLAAIMGIRSTFADQRFKTNEVEPVLDADNDLMPPVHEFVRGADWRGMDCNDDDANVRPGLRSSDGEVDSNCNGISGMQSENKRSYEDIYCNGSNNTYTMVMFGDSASSCFHIPPEYLHLKNLSDLIYVLMNEFDYPQLSWSTGFHESIAGESLYMNMRERNLCNHRDYQNVGHNGHRMTHFGKVQVPSLAINQKSKPIFAFQAYIGNDVCKSSHDKMTKVKDYVRDLKNGLAMLDDRVPPGSKLLIQGLVDGRILWEAMSSIEHPFGTTYEQLYKFLSCIGANPCETWLTPDTTSRDLTSEHAAVLSNAARKVVESSKGVYKNLELSYMDFPIKEAVKYVESIGKTADTLISPFDGFHLSIYGHRVMAMLVKQFLEKNHPDWLGVSNPYNKHIRERFGDQGGH